MPISIPMSFRFYIILITITRTHTQTPEGSGGDQDVRFHEGTCQGGSTSDACDLPIIGEPGGR
ncbi:MAG TPA: hypothetical protein VKA95_04645 [Nitrososphaeraceae archaeon]|jgi:hypothetical protein|nr:hypothetical protein [Nitrososphaeraceae archaeon]